VWSAPTNEELAEVYLVAKQMMLDVLEGPSKKFQERAQAIQAELHAVPAKPGQVGHPDGPEPSPEGTLPVLGDGRVRR
jgi:hypothetical protein